MENENAKVWVVFTGTNGEKWEDFKTNNIVAIGDKDGVNLNRFKNAKSGDFVFALTKGKVLGFGKITGDYKNDTSRESYPHTRTVEWLKEYSEEDIKILNKYNQKEHFTNFKCSEEESPAITDTINKYIPNNNYNNNLHKNENKLSKKEYKWKQQLLASHQIILTGAPGTGKTFAAKEIAAALTGETAERIGEEDCRIGFVQFHPSMDYTDFVEGLRPVKKDGDDDNDDDNDNDDNDDNDIKKQIGFERQDGIFKKFCASAAKSLDEFMKPSPLQEIETDIKNEFKNFINSIKDHEEIKLKKRKKFSPTDKRDIFIKTEINEDDTTELNVSSYYKDESLNPVYTKEKNGEIKEKTIKQNDIINIYSEFFIKHKKDIGVTEVIKNFGTSFQVTASFIVPICKVLDEYLKKKGEDFYKKIEDYKPTETEEKNDKTLDKFVFIIDEINRGDIAKIFGELFYAIDPSYRGKKGKITTQYQSLVDKPPFNEGFYVPENVYIIGTMNDIDRGVESMDFAIRRRFTWIEVKPKDTQDMLNSLDEKIEAIAKMDALNAVVSKIIGPAYQIGAAYFMKLPKLKEIIGSLNDDTLKDEFDALWKYHLEPLLREYLRGEPVEEIGKKITGMKNAYDLGEDYFKKLKDEFKNNFDELWKELIKEQGSSDSAEPEKR